jgi:hypothetical protein
MEASRRRRDDDRPDSRPSPYKRGRESARSLSQAQRASVLAIAGARFAELVPPLALVSHGASSEALGAPLGVMGSGVRARYDALLRASESTYAGLVSARQAIVAANKRFLSVTRLLHERLVNDYVEQSVFENETFEDFLEEGFSSVEDARREQCNARVENLLYALFHNPHLVHIFDEDPFAAQLREFGVARDDCNIAHNASVPFETAATIAREQLGDFIRLVRLQRMGRDGELREPLRDVVLRAATAAQRAREATVACRGDARLLAATLQESRVLHDAIRLRCPKVVCVGKSAFPVHVFLDFTTDVAESPVFDTMHLLVEDPWTQAWTLSKEASVAVLYSTVAEDAADGWIHVWRPFLDSAGIRAENRSRVRGVLPAKLLVPPPAEAVAWAVPASANTADLALPALNTVDLAAVLSAPPVVCNTSSVTASTRVDTVMEGLGRPASTSGAAANESDIVMLGGGAQRIRRCSVRQQAARNTIKSASARRSKPPRRRSLSASRLRKPASQSRTKKPRVRASKKV